jgi:hypothetical protein
MAVFEAFVDEPLAEFDADELLGVRQVRKVPNDAVAFPEAIGARC